MTYNIQIWNLKPGWGSRPDMHVEKGHSDDITGLKFSSDGQILLSRSFDETLKVLIEFRCLFFSVVWAMVMPSLHVTYKMYSRFGICAK